MHQPLQRKGPPGDEFDLIDYVEAGCIRAKAELANKNAVFSMIAEVFSEALELPSNQVLDALWARERTQNTSVGHGVAVPHATIPGLKRSCMGLFTVETPLPYQALDGVPVDVFIVTLGPPVERQTNLLLLATASKLVLNTDLLVDMRAADSPASIHSALSRSLEQLAESQDA